MGREIRRVPLNWDHPKDAQGHFIPLLDQDFETAAREWDEAASLWERGEHPDQKEYPEDTRMSYTEWHGERPIPDYYRPAYTSEPTAYQVYETVSEGTPISPVFPTKDQLLDWLMNDGSRMGIGGRRQRLSRHAAEAFVEDGHAVSMVFSPRTGLTSELDLYEREESR